MEKFTNTRSPEETFNLGQKLGQKLGKRFGGGEVICLYGELGAGKTVLAKGLAQGLGIKDEITSPTFTIIQEYDLPGGRLQFIHMDLYRLQVPEEADIIGVTDYFRENCICLVEWPEIIEETLPEDRLDITIEGSGDLPRVISLCYGENWNQILDGIL